MPWPRWIAVLAILFTSSTQAMDAAAFGVKQFPLRPTLIENNARFLQSMTSEVIESRPAGP